MKMWFLILEVRGQIQLDDQGNHDFVMGPGGA